MRISVIVSVFNNKDTVSDAINSIVSQDYDNIECIVVDAGSTDGTYDGAYAGTYNMTLSYNGYVCSFTSVTLQVLITNGDISTPFMTTASADCDLSFGTNTYSPQVYFDGLVLSGGVLSGTLSEDSQFVFESAWSGTVSDLGSGAYQIFANFEQEVTTAFPGSPTTVSGSFILNKQ